MLQLYAVTLKRDQHIYSSLKRERLLLLETELSKTTIFENPDVTFEKVRERTGELFYLLNKN